MGTLSKMAEKCKICPDGDKCDHKKMELCAYIDEPQIAINAGVVAGENCTMPAMRETMQINVGGVDIQGTSRAVYVEF